jgi:hypothetical protein
LAVIHHYKIFMYLCSKNINKSNVQTEPGSGLLHPGRHPFQHPQ